MVFTYAGLTKILHPERFATLIEAYGLLPDVLLMPVAVLLSLLEIFAGAGLILDIKGSLSLVSGMLILFIAVLAYGIGMGLDIDCGCFGPGDPEAEAFRGLREAILRDVVMLTMALFLFTLRRTKEIRPIGLTELVVGKNK